jgi:hypothetical protein
MTKQKKEARFKLLIDTCVWFDVAKDYQQQAILASLEELIRQGDIALILPRTVVDEFAPIKHALSRIAVADISPEAAVWFGLRWHHKTIVSLSSNETI